ncbi:MAG: carboxypeptidase regulatory-like domain-containing protein, partial [Phycisphaerales bacterium]
MHSRITQLAAAAVLALTVLLLARHLTGRERPATPEDRNRAVVQAPQGEDAPAPVLTTQEREAQLARELFAAADANGLLELLETGQDQTKIAVADYLALMGEESAIPALQKLADRWQGPANDNPFRKSIERILQSSSRREGVGGENRAQDQTPSTPGHDPRITVLVCEKATGVPIPNADIRTFIDGDTENRAHTADEKGAFILDLAGLTPEYVSISVSAGGCVAQQVQLRAVREQNLPRTVRFLLEEGTVIGGVVQDSAGQPVEGASVQLLGYVDQQAGSEQPRPTVSVKLTTDDRGRWRTDSVPARIETDLYLCVEHPEFADAQFSMPRDLTLEDLRAQRAVMVLDEGMTIVGHVADAAGTPIVGAEVGTRQVNGNRWTKTDAAGRFAFSQVSPFNQSFFVTVQARGYIPQVRELPSEKGVPPTEFVLEPAEMLFGRVIDTSGQPVDGALVTLVHWDFNSVLKWAGTTDANGVFAWDYAPAGEVQMHISKSGYRNGVEFLRLKGIVGDPQPTFVLARMVTIQGAVTDSSTGKPIRQFKVTPRWRGGNLYAAPRELESLAKWFTDGHYSYAFHDGGQANAVRIEAEGYLPQESRFVDANEPVATIDIALTRGEVERSASGYVFDANGFPVAGAQVIWGQNNVEIYNGRAAVDGRAHVHTMTGDDGRFVFQAAVCQDPLLVVSDRGIGGASYEEFVRNGFIMLKPWARVRGQWRIGSRLAANQELCLFPFYDQALPQAGMDCMKAVTDEDGRFVFEKVYPGKFMLYNETYTVEPGQTLDLLVGGAGRTVVGELVVPVASDVPIRAGLRLIPANVPVPFDKIPRPSRYEQMSVEEVRTWLAQFDESPEGKAYSVWVNDNYPQDDKYLAVGMDDWSEFHVDNVEPGVYVLRGEVSRGGPYNGSMMSVAPGHEHLLSRSIGSVWYEFEVPLPASDSELDVPLDLGLVPVRSETALGDPAPDFDVPTFGLDRIRLADYRGKTLLLTFVSESCFR